MVGSISGSLRWVRFFLVGQILLAAWPAAAATVDFRVLLDVDDDLATGCTVPTVDGPFAGVEQVLIASVETFSGGTASVVGVQEQICTVPGTNTFGPPTLVSPGGWAVGVGLGLDGTDVVEISLPASALPPDLQRLRLGVIGNGGSLGDTLLSTNPGGSGPIVLVVGGLITEIPTLGTWGILLLALLLGAAALGRLHRQAALSVLLAILAVGATVAGAVCLLDGDPSDWGALPPLGEDFLGDDSAGTDLRALFGRLDGGDLCLRVDVDLPVNQAPTADAQTVTTDEDTPVAFTLTGSDPESDPLTFSVTTPPGQGSLSGTAPNLTYTPDPNFAGGDSLTFQVDDGQGGTDTAVVTLTVDPMDDAPVAVDDSETVAEDAAATAISVLTNDTDIDGGAKTIASVTQPANGTVVITGGGTGLTYQPDSGYCNDPPGTTPDTFTYTLSPGSSSATVSVLVSCLDNPPVAVDDAATVTEDDPAAAIPVLTNDTDTDGGAKSIASVTQPTNGAVVITGGGTGLTYQPNADTCNTPPGTTLDTFTYTLSPGSSSATVSVTVTCVDDAPVAVDDSATVAEDDPATAISVLTNDTDIDAGAKTIASVTQPADGTVVITGGGTGLTYQPDSGFCNDPPGTTPDTFTYTLSPGSSSATVSVLVSCVDNPPVAVDDAATVTEDDAATAVPVLSNDTDVDGGAKSIASVTQPTNGAVVITGGGTGLTYQPNADYCNDPPGTTLDTFTYTLSPGSSSATVTVTVTCVDDDPVAVDDSATVTEDDPAAAIPVLTNDTDVDGGAKSIASVTQPTNGAVVITGGGTGLTYQPDADYCNNPPGTTPDTFTYTLSPGSASATVSVTVTCVDDAPVAVDDSATVTEDDAAAAIPVLTNDTDVDGGAKSIASVTQPTNGAVVITGGGTGLTYQPDADYCNNPPGSMLDSFTYTLSPGGSSATVSITVTCVDDAPVAVDDSATVTEDDPAAAVPVLGNDTDVDGGAKSVASVTQPTNGTVVITGGGTGLTYQPDADYCNNPPGSTLDTFTYTLSPGGSSATVTVTVTCVDDPPTAVADSATVTEDDPATAIPVLGNDTDPDGGAKSIASVTQPTNGAVVITGGGTGLTYQPDADYCNNPPGSMLDTFTYTLSPGGSFATVSVTVTCVDDPPTAVNDSATVTEDDPASAIPVLGNDTDPDGGAKSIASVTQPTNGTVVITGGGTGLTYQPAANYCNNPPGSMLDTFTYTLSPGGSSATVSVTVTCVDDPPTAVGDSATVTEDDPATAIPVLGNDTDPDGGAKSIASVTQPTNGAVVITGGGTGLTYQPAANYCNNPPGTTPDTFTYTLSPGGSFATVSVTVTCVNDPPVAGADAWETIGNTQLVVDLAAPTTPHVPATTGTTFGLLNNDSDPVEGSPVFVAGVVGCGDLTAPFGNGPVCNTANGGRVVVEANGRFTFFPLAGSSAADSFQYSLSDGTDTVTGTVNLTLQAMVWYVDNQAAGGGDGTSASAFDTLTPLDGAGGVGDSDGAGDYLFVHFGDGTSTGLDGGLELEASQHLIGEHAGLSIPVALNGGASPTVLVTAVPGNRPLVENLAAGANGVFATDVIPTEIVGLSLAGTVNAIDWTTTGAFAGTGTCSIRANVVRSAGAEGVDINAGGTGTLTLTFQNNTVTATGNGFDARTTAGALQLAFNSNPNLLSGANGAVIDGSGGGTLTVTGFSANSVHGNTAGSGLVVTSATFDAVPGGTLDVVTGGTTVVGASGNGVGVSALVLTSVSGDLSFTDLDLFADGGAALRLSGTGTFTGAVGTRLTVPPGVAIFAATGGPAVDLSNTTASAEPLTLTSTNSSTTGVSLSSVAGTFTAGSGSAITNATGTDFVVSGGTVATTYAGTITDDVGVLVSVANTTAGAKVWSGAITDGDDGDGSGISITNNSNSPISFTGGLTLSTGANPAFTATTNNVGALASLTVTGSTNKITTTTATALNVTNTLIGASGLNFRSISAGTGAGSAGNGIFLDTTGTSGGLTVAGTGGAGTGGTIQHKTGANATTAGIGIYLKNTKNVSLSSMQLNDFDNFAIRGFAVDGFTLSNTVINGVNGNSATENEGSVSFGANTGEPGGPANGLTGSASVTNSNISGAFEDNFRVANQSGSLNRLTFSGTTIGTNSTTDGNDGVLIEGESNATINVTVQSGTFTSARANLFHLILNGNNTSDLVFSGNTLTNNHPGIATGGGGVTIVSGNNVAAGANLTLDISGNSFRDADGHAVLLVKSTDPGTVSGTFANNTIGVAATADSGSKAGSGLKVQNAGLGTVTMSITGNQIRQYNNFGIELLTGGGATAQSGNLNATITGNTVSNPGTGGLPMNGIHLNGGTVPGDTYQICTKIGGAGVLANSITGSGANAGTDFRLRQRQATTVRLPGYGGATNDNTAVVTFGAGNNGGASGLASNNVPTGGGFVGGGSTCP